MSRDVTPPDPPNLTNRGLPSRFDPSELSGGDVELRRGAIEETLREGAWDEAFREWLEYSTLTETEYRRLSDSGLFEALDFYWDPIDGRLRLEVPDVPEELDEGDFGARASGELTDLAETVLETLEDTYDDWSDEEPVDAVWTEEMYDEESPFEE